jgi:hypothetical protein
MTTDTTRRAQPRTGDETPPPPAAEAPQPTPDADAKPAAAEPSPSPEEGVMRPPFPTRGDIDSEC